MGSRLVKKFEIPYTSYEDAMAVLLNWFNVNQFFIKEQTPTFIKAQKGLGGPAGKQIFEINLIKKEDDNLFFHGEFYLLIKPKMLSPPVEVAFREKGIGGIKLKEGWRLTENLIGIILAGNQVLTDTNSSEPAQNGEINCPSCGAKISQGYKFCTACGSDTTESKTSDLSYCSNCGNQVTPGYKFCEKCGNKI